MKFLTALACLTASVSAFVPLAPQKAAFGVAAPQQT